MLDAAFEAAKGGSKIGTTGKGIGPTYTDKISRNGVRVGDIFLDFKKIYEVAKARRENILESLGYNYDIDELERQWFEGIEYLKKFRIIDSEHEINRFLAEAKAILAEGAQGTLLDVDFGSYPFVTSSNTICAGACTGLGMGPTVFGEVYGIFKALYACGQRAFPDGVVRRQGEVLCRLGHEFGAVTGRKRRCGWLDMVALKYAIMVDGVTKLIMMKADVMNDFDTIKVAEAYEIDGRRVTEFPYDIQDDVEPVYREFKGWKTD